MQRAPPSGPGTDYVSARFIFSTICLVWYVVVWIVCAIGVSQLFRHYSKTPDPAICLTTLKDEDIPHVTIIRPAKGLEPRLYECLASTLRQTYPKDKLTISFCISSRSDPALPILERLLRDFPGYDARIYIEEDDPLLQADINALGPNPKIRNMSRAYREAKGDILWILDCNVWVGKGVCGRMVDCLCGYGGKTKYKFVHQTPLSVDLDGQNISSEERKQLLGGDKPLKDDTDTSLSRSTDSGDFYSRYKRLMQRGGARLDEAFMSSAHAKFYNAINTVLVAPCALGKSTIFRRSQLDYVTQGNPDRSPGLDFFSDNICEDHLIGDALWKKPQPFEKPGYKPALGEVVEKWGKHSLLFGDFCFQPMSHTSVISCIERRVRWLRVRKFTVTLATFVEPGTEALVCNLMGAYALTTLPYFATNFNIPPTWLSFLAIWLIGTSLWCLVDYIEYLHLHSAKTVELDDETPDFVLPQRSVFGQSYSSSREPLLGKARRNPTLLDGRRRTFRQWWFAWAGREVSALPIWVWAFWGGVTVEWRGKRFWVGLDMKVHEIKEGGK
ncbi:ceramide glucosyltransferase-like protein [Dendryphion nanum]|uniref:Ceramide glucosyltransferase n=1 Tax=Dendryphion nanum TaxID=256645 RepID=A0A9P9EDJ8_9PLEO|nr:ceramide glucosyltransferase-like protein [Dendryphion nanum]